LIIINVQLNFKISADVRKELRTYNYNGINNEESIDEFLNLKQNEFNFTTNPTRVLDNNSGLLNTFNGTMTYDAVGSYQQFTNSDRPPNPPASPTTFITQIDLYDMMGTRVATAKLSKPIKKDFNSEVRIKIMISDY